MPVLELRHIIKHFGAIHSLNDVDLSLDAGEVLGLMGAKKVDGIAVAAAMANAREGANAGGIPDFLPDAHRSVAAKHKDKVTPGKKNGKAAPKHPTSTGLDVCAPKTADTCTKSCS